MTPSLMIACECPDDSCRNRGAVNCRYRIAANACEACGQQLHCFVVNINGCRYHPECADQKKAMLSALAGSSPAPSQDGCTICGKPLFQNAQMRCSEHWDWTLPASPAPEPETGYTSKQAEVLSRLISHDHTPEERRVLRDVIDRLEAEARPECVRDDQAPERFAPEVAATRLTEPT